MAGMAIGITSMNCQVQVWGGTGIQKVISNHTTPPILCREKQVSVHSPRIIVVCYAIRRSIQCLSLVESNRLPVDQTEKVPFSSLSLNILSLLLSELPKVYPEEWHM